jgi:hypothetical protein
MLKPMTRASGFWVAGVVASLVATAAPGPALGARDRPFVGSGELKGISDVNLEVEGLPNPIGQSQTSEKTIRDAIVRQLTAAGLKVTGSIAWPKESPTLRIRVLAPRTDSQYAYVVSVELEERCTVARTPSLTRGPCETWSIYPRIGFLPLGQESSLSSVATLAVQQFVDAWVYDSRQGQ